VVSRSQTRDLGTRLAWLECKRVYDRRWSGRGRLRLRAARNAGPSTPLKNASLRMTRLCLVAEDDQSNFLMKFRAHTRIGTTCEQKTA